MRSARLAKLSWLFAALTFAQVASLPAARAADDSVIARVANYRGADRTDILVKGAREEGKLNFYSSMLQDAAMRPLIAAFQAKYPFIKVDSVRADQALLMQKLLAEARAGNIFCDVVESTSIEVPTRKANLVRQFWSPELDAYAADKRDPEGYWAPTRVSYLGMAYNTNLVAPNEVPKTFQDLLDPKWKGKMAWSNEELGSILFVTGVRHFMGEEKALEYLKKLGTQNIVPMASSNRTVLDRVIAGEYAMSLDAFLHHPILSAAKGAPVSPGLMEPIVAMGSSVELIRLAPHPHAAMLFIDFLLSSNGQEALRQAQYFPARDGVAALPNLAVVTPSKVGMKENFISPEYFAESHTWSVDIINRYFTK